MTHMKTTEGHVSKTAGRTKRQRAKNRCDALSGKTFEDLSAGEKDCLLKSLAVRAGLILDSD